MLEVITKEQFQSFMAFSVQQTATFTLSGIDKPWKRGVVDAFKILDFGYCLDIISPSRETVDAVKLPEPYAITLEKKERSVKLDYTLEMFLEHAPVGVYIEKFLRFKIKPEKGRESKLSNRKLMISFL